MLYNISHLVNPTSIRHALKCDLIQSGLDSLIIGKHSQIQVYQFESESLNFICQSSVYDVIEHVNSFKRSNDSTATLLVITSNLRLITFQFCPTSRTIVSTATVSLHRNGSRPADHLCTSLVDPHGRCVIIHALNGIIHVMPLVSQQSSTTNHPIHSQQHNRSILPPIVLKTKSINSSSTQSDTPQQTHLIFQLALNELNVHSIAFATLPSSYHPTLLILYSNHLGHRVLRLRKIDLQTNLCDHNFPKSYTCRDPTTRLIIPVSTTNIHDNTSVDFCGAILVGEESAQLVCFLGQSMQKFKTTHKPTTTQEPKSSRADHKITGKVRIPLGVYTCFSQINDLSQRWILGDVYGTLIILHLALLPSGRSFSLKCIDVGQFSSTEALVYIPPGFLLLVSHYGDSQLLKLPSNVISFPLDSIKPDALEIVTTFTNLAPISDFCINQDPASQSNNQIVTCSGAYRDCSLRIIKFGIRSKDSQSLDISDVRQLWPLKSSTSFNSSSDFHDRILLSFADCTRFLALKYDGTIEEVKKLNGFRSDTHSIFAGNLIDYCLFYNHYAIQITPHQVIAGETLRWESESGKLITCAAITLSTCVISLGRELLILHIKNGSFIQKGTHHVEIEISSIAIDPQEKFIAVAQWITNAVEIISIQTQTRTFRITTHPYGIINSLVMIKFEERLLEEYELLVGFSDSKVLNYSLLSNGHIVKQNNSRVINLGTRPIQFVPLTVGTSNGTRSAIWANGDHPVLIFDSTSDGRLAYKSITIQGGPILYTSTLNAQSYQDSIILVFEKEIRIEKLDMSPVHFRKIPLDDEQPKRIAHSQTIKAFGLLCTRSEINAEARLGITGSFKIFDDETFQLLYNYPLLPSEQGLSISVLKLGDAGIERFVIGTGIINQSGTESTKGRILAFGEVLKETLFTSNRSFKLMNLIELSGPIGGLGSLPNGMFVACVNGSINAYRIREGVDENLSDNRTRFNLKFELVDSQLHGCLSDTVVTHGNKVLVVNNYKSVVVLEFDMEQSQFMIRAQDLRNMSVRRIGMISDNEFIAADNELNLFTLKQRTRQNDPREENDSSSSSSNDDSDIYEQDWLNQNKKKSTIVKSDDNLVDLFQTGAFHLGENVNQFRAGRLIPKIGETNSKDPTELIFVTSTGGIGSISRIKKSKRRMESLMPRSHGSYKGCLDIAEYRKFKNKTMVLDSKGFIDGNYLKESLNDIMGKMIQQTSQLLDERVPVDKQVKVKSICDDFVMMDDLCHH